MPDTIRQDGAIARIQGIVHHGTRLHGVWLNDVARGVVQVVDVPDIAPDDPRRRWVVPDRRNSD